ncbi:MAG: DUF3383 family protein [Kofleriaceae bacterium]
MSLDDHVSITITADTLGVPRAGFGVPMILSVNASFPERLRYYTDIPGVAEDFPDPSSPEHLAANAILAQDPHPERIAIGRATGKPTQRYKVSVSTVENSHLYKLAVRGDGVTATDITFQADSTATDGEVAVGLVAALNAVAGKNFTASGTTSPISITGDAAGEWFSVESPEVGYLKIEQDHADPATSVAVDLAAIATVHADWYALYTLYNSEAYVKAAAAWVETQKRLYIADISASETVTLASAGTGASDAADDLMVLGYDRTAVVYHPSPASMLGAAWLGTRLWTDAGSENWKFADPTGVLPVSLTTTHKTNLEAKNANTLESTGRNSRMWAGTVASGEFIDVIRGIDWLENDMQTEVYDALASALKVPFTDAGIALIENKMLLSLGRGVSRGLLADDPKPVVRVPKAKDVASSDKKRRILPDLKFSGVLAGAVNKTRIRGVVSV